MSSPFSLITQWIRNNESWRYTHESTIDQPIRLAAHQELNLPPYAERIFNYPEMILNAVVMMFDHYLCGVRLRWDPGYDSKRDFTVYNVALGSAGTDPNIYAKIPPTTPPGIFILHIPSFWPSTGNARLAVFNDDSSPHYFIGHGYILMANTSKREDK